MSEPQASVHHSARVHATAELESGTAVGPGTAVWSHVHVRAGARIGADCIVGEKTYVAYDVVVGDRVKLNAFVYVCAGVTIEDGVMVGAGTVFTNDRYPRAASPDLTSLRPSEPGAATRPTTVRAGASIGAGCVIGCDLEIGRWAMVGMGSVVTRSVPPFHLVVGNPARSVGAVCACGQPVARIAVGRALPAGELRCGACGATYTVDGATVTPSSSP